MIIGYMLASILTNEERENVEWLRCANKYAEHTCKTDCGFYKEYDYVVQMLSVTWKFPNHKD
jgi:hypothetical protein